MKLYKIGYSKINNKGLFANKDIKKGTRIINYVGKIITKKETERNPKFDNNKAIYLYNLNRILLYIFITVFSASHLF